LGSKSCCARNFRVTSSNGEILANTEFSALTHIHPGNVGGNGWTAMYANQGSGGKAGFFIGDVLILGNLGIGITSSSVAYPLDINGLVRVNTGSFGGLILGQQIVYPSPSLPNLAITAEKNNVLCIGTYDKWANRIWSYTVECQTLLQPSDMRLKENIKFCFSLLSKLKNVNTYNYNYTDEFFKDFDSIQKEKTQRTEYGFLAQELQKIFPELVYENDSDKLSINYIGMIPILTAAINEMQKGTETRDSVIDALMQKVESLENALIACCSKKTQKSIQSFELTDPTAADELKVYQNVPNPFNETTIISCYIPESIGKAELCVYDMQGSLLKCFLISERGTTNVQIQAGQLAAGIYTYLLIGDSKTSDTKQMILTK
jgi:hypothetical protein